MAHEQLQKSDELSQYFINEEIEAQKWLMLYNVLQKKKRS